MKKSIAVIVLTILITVGGISSNFGENIGGILPVTAATNIYSQDGIGYSGPISGNEVIGTAFTGYQAWPSGFTKGSSAFVGGVYDGTSIWMIPYNANELVKVNPTTGEMTGYSNWPAGFTKGSNAFAGGVYDGANIWLIPYSADQIIKVNVTTGEMTGYSAWPGGSKGSDQFIGGTFDGTNIWLSPYSGSRLIKVDAKTGAMTSYNSWPSGTILGSYPFYGSIFDGTSIWLIPNNADRLIKVDPATGDMNGYNNWPSGFTKGANAFSGGVFDGTNLWLVPHNATHVVKIDTATGDMTGYNEWPSRFTKGSGSFTGGVYDGTNLWLIPNNADRLIKVDSKTGEMTGYNNWPSGFAKQNSAFLGGVYDGGNVWMIPFMADRLIKFGYSSDLSGLTISEGILSPAFKASTMNYTANVANEVTSIDVTPTILDATATVTVDGMPIANGQAQPIALNEGANEITVVVTAGNGQTKTYTITITRAASGNVNLSGLTISAGTLSPVFDASTTNYMANVANEVTSIDVTPTTMDATATVTVDGMTIASGQAHPIALNEGDNAITVVVTAGNGQTKTYTITITRAASGNVNLNNLTISAGTLSPAFDASTTNYRASVANEVTSIDVTPTTDATATVTVNDMAVASGQAQTIVLNEGDNEITVVVTARNGQIKTYTIIVTRAASNNTITPSTTHFDKYFSATSSQDIQIDLAGNTLQQIEVDTTVLPTNAYQVNSAGDRVILKKEFLATLSLGTHSFVFKFSAGNDATFTLTVTDSSPTNSSTDSGTTNSDSPTNSNIGSETTNIDSTIKNTTTLNTMKFDKFVSAVGYQDVQIQLNLAGNTLQQIEVDGAVLPISTYQINSTDEIVTLKKEFLATLSPGTYRFVFKFNSGNDAEFILTVTESTDKPSPIEPNMENQQENVHDFSDVDTEFWASEAIQSLVSKGIILGYSNNEFRPNELIRREHMILMISRLGLLTEKRGVLEFTDVPVDYIYYNEIRFAQLAGIIDGSDGKFYPKKPLTRAHAAKVIVQLFDFKMENAKSFDDVSDDAWYAPYISTLAKNNIVFGNDGYFNPNENITRAQFAAMLYRALQIVEK